LEALRESSQVEAVVFPQGLRAAINLLRRTLGLASHGGYDDSRPLIAPEQLGHCRHKDRDH
jgi:hypothetical protein